MTESTLYLLDVDDAVDESILRRWVDDHGVAGSNAIVVPHPATDSLDQLDELARELPTDTDVRLSPLRVSWLPQERNGDRSVRLRDAITGDPRNPSERRKRRLLRGHPGRSQVVVAETARLSELAARSEAPSGSDRRSLARFVALQALKSLERAEYRASGARYKVPRLVREDLTARRRSVVAPPSLPTISGVRRRGVERDRRVPRRDGHRL